MVLVSDIARLAAKIELALTTMVLVSAMANDVNVNLVAATAMVDWSKISTWTFEITVAPTDMVDVALMATLGSNVPLE
jgi:hypothetical protein